MARVALCVKRSREDATEIRTRLITACRILPPGQDTVDIHHLEVSARP